MGKIIISLYIMSEWIKHVKQFQAQHGCSYKDALRGASASYRSMKGSGPAWAQPRSDTGQMYTKGGNLKKTSKAQLKRLVVALGDKAIGRLSGMGAVGDMLKQTAANTTAQLITSGGDRASSEMTTRGTGMRKMFPGFYGMDLLAATRGRGVKNRKLTGMGAVGDMLKQTAANTTAQLITSGGDRASSEMTTRGTGVNRLKKAERWEQFSNAALRDAIDTAGKAGRVYYDTMNPMAQMGFGLKKHRKLKGKALMAAGYS